MIDDTAPLTAATPEEFARAMEMLFLGLGRPMPDDRTLVVWRAILARLTGPQLFGAVQSLLRSGDAWPNAGKLLQLAQAGPSGEDRAALALAAVRRAVVRCGRYAAVDIDDPVAAATIRDLGGWGAVCGLDLDDHWTARRFREQYVVRLRCGVPPALALPLAGEFGLRDPVRIETGLPPITPQVPAPALAGPAAAATRLAAALPSVR
jgi:hypothetical protein